MSRKCGYCRLEGHMKRKCPVVEEETRIIKTHVPAERKAVHDLLLKNGYGVGAIVNAWDSWEAEYKPAVITTLKTVPKHRFTTFSKRRYLNRHYIRLESYTGIRHIDMSDKADIMVINPIYLRIPIYFLHDMSRNETAEISYDQLEILSHRSRDRNHMRFERHTRILTPSDETDVDDVEFVSKVSLSAYLVSDNESQIVDGIKSW